MVLIKEERGDESSLTLTLLLKHSFHKLSLTLLTLLLPLSFLLLAKLASQSPSSFPSPSSTLLRLLVSFLSISSLLYSLTGHLPKPRTAVTWAFLCTFQVCISLGIEATIAAGIKPLGTTVISQAMWIERAVFLLGLYETMLLWARMFVRPVVDDTVFGAVMEEGGADKVAIGVAFGALWLWMLRDEVETLVLAAGKVGLVRGMVGWNGFVLWLVSYSTVVIGMVRVVEVFLWVGKVLFLFLCCRGEVDEVSVCSVPENEEV